MKVKKNYNAPKLCTLMQTKEDILNISTSYIDENDNVTLDDFLPI